jgi:hypothetical protein
MALHNLLHTAGRGVQDLIWVWKDQPFFAVKLHITDSNVWSIFWQTA